MNQFESIKDTLLKVKLRLGDKLLCYFRQMGGVCTVLEINYLRKIIHPKKWVKAIDLHPNSAIT